MSEPCPACSRGILDEKRQCSHCRVFVAAGSGSPWAGSSWRRPKRRADQDRIGPYTEYARTKEDRE